MLFDSFAVKALSLKNRVMMSPMCQYSVVAEDGKPNDWHNVHYVSRAVGGAGLIMMEMTDVVPDGRITVHDLGIWSDEHIEPFRRIIDQVHHYGARIGIQIAHAGRKTESESLIPFGPSPIPFSSDYRTPKAMTPDDIKETIDAFYQGARRAVAAGADTVELHGAHGYLIHQFMSPLSNQRTDEYGDPSRFALDVIHAIKEAIPSQMPLLMRLSAIEHDPNGYSFQDLMNMARKFRDAGVDMLDVSTGGNDPHAPSRVFPGYQVPYASQLRRDLQIPVIAVGMLESPALAESVLSQGEADIIAIARGLLRDPYWANNAAQTLGKPIQVPAQYYRAFPSGFQDR